MPKLWISKSPRALFLPLRLIRVRRLLPRDSGEVCPFPGELCETWTAGDPSEGERGVRTFGCNLFRLTYNRWLWLWFHSFFHHDNASNILSDWYLVTYAGSYACICFFFFVQVFIYGDRGRIVICQGGRTEDISFQIERWNSGRFSILNLSFVIRSLRHSIDRLLLDPCWASRDRLCPQRGFTSSTNWRLRWGSSSLFLFVL